MFRSIEGIYKANRGLHAVCPGCFCCDRYLRKRQKLKDISADPKSAGELGGLLIRWVRDGFFLVQQDYSFR
jgi:hypothetical protein